MKNASIIMATRDRDHVIGKSLKGIMNQDFPAKYELIVVNDGSRDGTKGILDSTKGIRAIHLEKSKGPAFARNRGIEISKYPVIVVMDDDCIPDRNWLKGLISPFSDRKTGLTTSYGPDGGASTAYLKKAIEKAGFFDEIFPFALREDNDLVFRILDQGYEMRHVKANYTHEHKLPETLAEKVRYGLKRIKMHQIDCILYRKNPKRVKKFLDVKLGFLVNPMKDFKVATRMWSRGGKISLSSPRGIVLIENRSVFHLMAIILFAMSYVFLIKSARLYGSFKYGKLLV